MFIKSSSPTIQHTATSSKTGEPQTDPHREERQETEFTFNIKRLLVAATLLLVILVFAIGTAFFDQLAQIHTMLVHAFELILGLVAGLLGGEAIAKAEKA